MVTTPQIWTSTSSARRAKYIIHHKKRNCSCLQNATVFPCLKILKCTARPANRSGPFLRNAMRQSWEHYCSVCVPLSFTFLCSWCCWVGVGGINHLDSREQCVLRNVHSSKKNFRNVLSSTFIRNEQEYLHKCVFLWEEGKRRWISHMSEIYIQISYFFLK